MRLKIKTGDIIVVLVIVIASVVMIISYYKNDTDEKYAVITQNSVVLKEIRLDLVKEPITIDYGGEYPGEIVAENGKIRFVHAECPDQVCVKTGWITRPGQIAVCLPAGVVVKIEGGNSDFDIIVK